MRASGSFGWEAVKELHERGVEEASIRGEVRDMKEAGWQPPSLFSLSIMEAWGVKEAGFPAIAEQMLEPLVEAFGVSVIGKAMMLVASTANSIRKEAAEERAAAARRR